MVLVTICIKIKTEKKKVKNTINITIQNLLTIIKIINKQILKRKCF